MASISQRAMKLKGKRLRSKKGSIYLLGMVSNLLAMASNPVAMASNQERKYLQCPAKSRRVETYILFIYRERERHCFSRHHKTDPKTQSTQSTKREQTRLKAIPIRVQAIATRMEAIAIRLDLFTSRFEASLLGGGHLYLGVGHRYWVGGHPYWVGGHRY